MRTCWAGDIFSILVEIWCPSVLETTQAMLDCKTPPKSFLSVYSNAGESKVPFSRSRFPYVLDSLRSIPITVISKICQSLKHCSFWRATRKTNKRGMMPFGKMASNCQVLENVLRGRHSVTDIFKNRNKTNLLLMLLFLTFWSNSKRVTTSYNHNGLPLSQLHWENLGQ